MAREFASAELFAKVGAALDEGGNEDSEGEDGLESVQISAEHP